MSIADKEYLLKRLVELSKLFNFKKKQIRAELSGIFDNIIKVNSDLQTIIKNVESENKTLLDNISIKDFENNELINKNNEIIEKLDIISSILAAEPISNEPLSKFKECLYGEFINFANNESSLADEASVILAFQSIEKELEIISAFPDVHLKNVIAIGGSFSSGKSSFLNSLILSEKIKLPVGIEPVTAIPSYIINGEKDLIKGISNNGGIIDISVDFYSKLSRNFINSFNFNLKSILPFITVSTLIEQYNNICFIDTPGYNPATTEHLRSEDDKKTTKEFLEQASSLIWVIGMDSHGTISSSDIDFIRDLNIDEKKLFVLLNKADLRSESDIKKILDEIAHTLEDYDIKFEGISSYSSLKKTEYGSIKKSLKEFLDEADQPKKIRNSIIDRLDNLFEKYKIAIAEQIKWIGNVNKDIKSLELDLLEKGYIGNDNTDLKNSALGVGFFNNIFKSLLNHEKESKKDDTIDKISNRINSLKKHFDAKTLIEQLNEVEQIRNTMISTINNFFTEIDKI